MAIAKLAPHTRCVSIVIASYSHLTHCTYVRVVIASLSPHTQCVDRVLRHSHLTHSVLYHGHFITHTTSHTICQTGHCLILKPPTQYLRMVIASLTTHTQAWSLRHTHYALCQHGNSSLTPHTRYVGILLHILHTVCRHNHRITHTSNTVRQHSHCVIPNSHTIRLQSLHATLTSHTRYVNTVNASLTPHTRYVSMANASLTPHTRHVIIVTSLLTPAHTQYVNMAIASHSHLTHVISA